MSIFVPGIRNMQRLTATVEQAVNRLNYNNNQGPNKDNNKLEYYKSNNRHTKRDESWTPYIRTSYSVVIRNLHRSVQQELVREDTGRMRHKIINVCNIRHRVIGNSLSPFLAVEQAAIRMKCNTENIYKISEPKLSHLTKSKIIRVYNNARDAKRTSKPRVTAHT
jgi:hypothetical protein